VKTPETNDYWALLNLILAILGVILAIVATLVTLLRRGNQYLWLFVVLSLAVVGLVVFFATQDLRNEVGLVDMWTIVHAVVFLAGLISLLLVFKKDKDEYRGYKS